MVWMHFDYPKSLQRRSKSKEIHNSSQDLISGMGLFGAAAGESLHAVSTLGFVTQTLALRGEQSPCLASLALLYDDWHAVLMLGIVM